MQRKDLSVLLLLVGLACLARLLALADHSLSLDEGYSIFLSKIPVETLIGSAGLDSNPPLGNLFFRLWCPTVRFDPVLMKLPGVLVSILALLLIERLLNPLLPLPARLFVLFFKAVSLYDVLYASQLRIYPFAETALIVSWIGVRNLLATGHRRDAALWATGAALACHLHYFSLLVVAASGGILIWNWWRRPEVRNSIIFGCLLCALLVAPLSLPLGQQMLVYKSFDWIKEPDPRTLLVAIWQMSGFSLGVETIVFVVVFSLLVLKLDRGESAPWRNHRPLLFALLWLITAVPTLAFAGSLLGGSFFHHRYLFYIQVPCLVLVALGLLGLPRKLGYITALTMIVCAGVITGRDLSHLPPLPLEARELQELVPRLPADAVIVHRTKCSYVLGLAYTRFAGTHRLLEGGGRTNVFQFPGIGEVYLPLAALPQLSHPVIVDIPGRC